MSSYKLVQFGQQYLTALTRGVAMGEGQGALTPPQSSIEWIFYRKKTGFVGRGRACYTE